MYWYGRIVDVKILDLKQKVAIHSGTPVDFQRLELRGADGSFVLICGVDDYRDVNS